MNGKRWINLSKPLQTYVDMLGTMYHVTDSTVIRAILRIAQRTIPYEDIQKEMEAKGFRKYPRRE